MSFYDDYVAEGLCCQSCGAFLGDEPGYPRFCAGCEAAAKRERRKIHHAYGGSKETADEIEKIEKGKRRGLSAST